MEVLCGNSQGVPSLPGPQAHLQIRDRTLGASVNQLPFFTAPFALSGESTAQRRMADLSHSPHFRHIAEKHQFSLFHNHYNTFSPSTPSSTIFTSGSSQPNDVCKPQSWRNDLIHTRSCRAYSSSIITPCSIHPPTVPSESSTPFISFRSIRSNVCTTSSDVCSLTGNLEKIVATRRAPSIKES